jgi:hypothetical protein
MNKLKLISLRTKNLKKKQIISICKLKNSHWEWTVPKQLKWFKKNVKKMDINNMLLINDKLIGYTLLRKRKANQNNFFFAYYYFDSFLLLKKWRKKSFGRVLMLYNNKILNNLKKHAFLICPKNMIFFYKKYQWKVLPKSFFKLMDHKPRWFKNINNVYGMTYMLKKNNKKIFYYLNKT